MKFLGTLALLLAVAANAALFAWQLRSPPKTVVVSSTGGPVVMRTPGGLLEVSTVTAEERFDSSTSHTVLGVRWARQWRKSVFQRSIAITFHLLRNGRFANRVMPFS